MKISKKTKKILAWVATVIVLAVIVVIVVLELKPMAASKLERPDITWITAEPSLYDKDGSVHIAHGSFVTELNGATKFDGKADVIIGGNYAYYATEPDEISGRFTLMAQNFTEDEDSIHIADDVDKATVIDDGMRVEYTVGEDEIQYVFEPGKGSVTLHDDPQTAAYLYDGTLYQRIGGEMQPIAKNVEKFGVSPGGKAVYYLQETGSEYALYVKVGSEEAVFVDEAKDIDEFYIIVSFGGSSDALFGDGGKLCYNKPGIAGYSIYLYTPEDGVDRITSNGWLWHAYAPDELVLMGNGHLYYKAPGERKDRIIKDFGFVFFNERFFRDVKPVIQRRFLVMAYKDRDNYDDTLLYEFEVGKKPILLAETGGVGSYAFDYGFEWLAYLQDGNGYIMHRTDEGWTEPKLISDNDKIELSLTDAFDMDGEYLYYFENYDEETYCGDLMRYDLNTGENQLLKSNVNSFYLIEDVPYAKTEDNTLYRADTAEMLSENVQGGAGRANSGITFWVSEDEYVYDGENIRDAYYYDTSTGEVVRIFTEVKHLSASTSLKARPAPTEELLAELSEIYYTAEWCLSILDDIEELRENKTMWYQTTQHIVELLEDEDTLGNAALVLDEYREAFSGLSMVFGVEDMLADPESDIKNMAESTKNKLEKAMEMHVELLGQDSVKTGL